MISELRQAKRITDYLPIGVTAKNGKTGTMIAGPFSGRIINISSTGACLLMSQVMINNYHVFHSTCEDDSFFLNLNIHLPPEISHFNIPSRPVWLNLFFQDEIRAFTMGVEFMTNPDGQQMKQLLKSMARQQKKRGRWWSLHLPKRTKSFRFSHVH